LEMNTGVPIKNKFARFAFFDDVSTDDSEDHRGGSQRGLARLQGKIPVKPPLVRRGHAYACRPNARGLDRGGDPEQHSLWDDHRQNHWYNEGSTARLIIAVLYRLYKVDQQAGEVRSDDDPKHNRF
jgi:hypothetical protein